MHDHPLTVTADALEGVFEHAPWVAARTLGRGPFPSVAALHDALMQTVRAAPERLEFLRGHPDLAADRLAPDLTAASHAEQAGLAMAQAADATALPALNAAYRARHGFPFIVCVARHTPEDVLRELRRRLERETTEETDAALDEIGHITRLRLLARLPGPGAPTVAGHLSTHALDLVRGRPASGLAVTLLAEGRPVAEGRTDGDGRLAGLLPPGPLRQGRYEFRFAVGAYAAAHGRDSFFDEVPIRFRIDDAAARYHIPLLLAPFGYSTYRGS